MRLFLTAIIILAWTLGAHTAHADYKMSESKGSFRLLSKDITSAIGTAIAEDGVAENVHVSLRDSRQKVLYRHSSPLQAEIRTLEYDEETQKFDAILYVISQNKELTAIPLTGKYERMIPVPVLKARHYKEDIIAPDAFTTKFIPESKVRKDVILNPAKMVGMSPKRVISADRPIRNNDVARPFTISKGDVITMRFRSGMMEITTMGEALEDGAKGQRIKLKNKDSGLSVYGQVISAQEVNIYNPNAARTLKTASR